MTSAASVTQSRRLLLPPSVGPGGPDQRDKRRIRRHGWGTSAVEFSGNVGIPHRRRPCRSRKASSSWGPKRGMSRLAHLPIST